MPASFGFLGPNGSGKSTTVKMLTGILNPSAGDALIDGLSIRNSSLEIKRRIGVLPEDLALFDSLTIWEHLKLCGPIYGLSAQETEARAEQLLNYLDLWPDRHTPVEQSSFGMKKKCALAMALIHNPKVLFLDEPFEGIDPVASRSIKDLLVQSGSLVDIIIGVIVASTPAAVIVYAFAVEDGSVAWKLAGLTLLWLALYLLSLSRSARVLETDHEQIRRALLKMTL